MSARGIGGAALTGSLLLAALLACAGCGKGNPSQVMVYVQAEEQVRARATRLEVKVEGGPAAGLREPKETLVYSGPSSEEGFGLEWPVRIALEPEGGDVTRTFRLVATATDADGLVAETIVVGGYLPGEALALHVWLRDACIGVVCDQETETCSAGTCVPVTTVDPCSLETLDGARPNDCLDAGHLQDGGEDATVDAGDDDAGVVDPIEKHNVVFVTSTQQAAGSLGGLEGADALCRARAEAGGLPRPTSYVAWLTDDTVAAIDRLSGSRGWVRPDGRPFVDTLADLENGLIYYPPALDEHGTRPPPSQATVVTGTQNNGTPELAAYRCGEWTVETGNIWTGNALDGTGRWSSTGTLSNCGASVAILCFGTGMTAPLDPPDATGSLAFISKGTLSGSDSDVPDGGAPMGISRFDELCQAEAAGEGRAGTYVALLGTTTQAAVDRLPTAAAPWVRPDGVVVAENKLAIANESLLAPVTVTVDGVQYVSRQIWAGAGHPGSPWASNANCSDWTDGDFGFIGVGGSTYDVFVDGSYQGCGGPFHVLCFQTAD